MLIRHCGKVCECVVRRLYTTPCFRLLLACAPLNSMDTAFDNTRHLWLITLKGVLSCAKNYFWDDNCKKKKRIIHFKSMISELLSTEPYNHEMQTGLEEGKKTVNIQLQKWTKQKNVCTGNSGKQQTRKGEVVSSAGATW